MDKDPRTFFIQDQQTGKIRFTRAGIEHFARRFAKVGMDIHRIRTLEAFQAACDASFEREIQEALAEAGDDPELRRALRHLPFLED